MQSQEINVNTDESKVSNAHILLSLEDLIKSHVESIRKLSEEKKSKNQLLKDSYESDSVYHEQAEKAKEAKKLSDATKATILSQPSNFKLKEEVKDITSDLKEKKEALSEYLLEYKRISGATQLELFPGEFVDIVLTAKVKNSRK
jgi:hypothetical protein